MNANIFWAELYSDFGSNIIQAYYIIAIIKGYNNRFKGARAQKIGLKSTYLKI